MKWLKNFSFSKLFANKKIAVSFSIVLAFVFWLIIVLDQNPDMSRTFKDVPITINSKKLEKMGLTITSKDYTDTVDVSVNGPGYVVSALSEGDIAIVADLSRINSEGTYQVDLVASPVGNNTDFEIVDVSLDSILIHVDKISDKNVPVTAEAPNIKLDLDFDGDLIRGDTILSEEYINIEGPKSQLDLVASAKAFVETTASLRADATFEGKIKLYDKDGHEIDPEPFTFNKSINVTYKVLKVASLPIVPSFTKKPVNDPSLTYEIFLPSGEKIQTIDVKGPVDLINSMTEIQLAPIDFYDIYNGKKFNVGFLLPSESIEIVNQTSTVTLEFDLQGYSVKVYNNIEIEVVNPKAGYTITPSKYPSISLYVPDRSIKDTDIKAVVDLSNASPGDSIQVAFSTKKGLMVWEKIQCMVTLKATN